jgi:SAM-dependent MidA family methyltransferase
MERAAQLKAGKDAAAAAALEAAVERLTAPDQMGTLFKVMAIHPGRSW